MITVGYEMFDVVGDDDNPSEPIHREMLDPVEWPEAEVHDGIFHVCIHAYGDHPQSAMVHVVGSDSDAVKDTWKRVRSDWPRLQAVIWK